MACMACNGTANREPRTTVPWRRGEQGDEPAADPATESYGSLQHGAPEPAGVMYVYARTLDLVSV